MRSGAWFVAQLRRQAEGAGEAGAGGGSGAESGDGGALLRLLGSARAEEHDFTTQDFARLLADEADALGADGSTALMALCARNPRLLRHDWALMLVQRHGGARDRESLGALMHLWRSPGADAADFDSRAFRALFARECEMRSFRQETALSLLCGGNPQLLNARRWFLPQLLGQCGCADSSGQCALMHLLRSARAADVDFAQQAFHQLFTVEAGLRDRRGRTALMHLCAHAPRLLASGHWFVEELVAQAGAQDRSGETALMHLFAADALPPHVFDAEHFQQLYRRERKLCSAARRTPLMQLCRCNHQLLDHRVWFLAELLAQAPARSEDGETALDLYRERTAERGRGLLRLQDALMQHTDGDAEHELVAERFMALEPRVKERQASQRERRAFGGLTLALLLCQLRPGFLALDEPWVDILLTAEHELRCPAGMGCLAHLLHSQRLQELDTGCARFRKLLERQRAWVDESGHTTLMHLCDAAPRLLREEWASVLVQQQAGQQAIGGKTALMLLLQSQGLAEAELDCGSFQQLLQRERALRTDAGQGALMFVCGAAPQLLSSSWVQHMADEQGGWRD